MIEFQGYKIRSEAHYGIAWRALAKSEGHSPNIPLATEDTDRLERARQKYQQLWDKAQPMLDRGMRHVDVGAEFGVSKTHITYLARIFGYKSDRDARMEKRRRQNARRIIDGMAKGQTLAEIARELRIGVSTAHSLKQRYEAEIG